MTAASRALLVGLVVVAALGIGYAVWPSPNPPEPPSAIDDEPVVTPDPPPPDPRVHFTTPFRNVRPDVAYVGDAACAGCHPKIVEQYRGHPMGRSAEPATGTSPVERYDPAAKNPFTVAGREFRIERADGKVVHRMTAGPGEYAVPVDLALGSGTRGRSYLTADAAGAVWQSPASWYSPDGGRWDLSPGFDLGGGHAGRRPVSANCLFCHVNHVEPLPGTSNRFKQPVFAGQTAVGCERCHGPGALHVAEQASGRPAGGGPDHSIVNPKHLPANLRGAVCEQCHLQAQGRIPRRGRDVFEYRPGLPLEEFITVLARHPDLADGGRSVGQVEQMERSKCFTASAGTFGCTSCHDPHRVPAPAQKDTFYRARCQTCHDRRPCTAPPAERTAKADSCVGCHMPRGDSSNIIHASVTDHAVPRRPAPPAAAKGLPPGVAPLVPFRPGPAADLDRAVGIGLVENLAGAPARSRPPLAASAADRLAAGLALWPGDAAARVARAGALGAAGKGDEALAEARAAARLAPGWEQALSALTTAATETGRYELAIETATAWAAVSPTAVDPLTARAAAKLRSGDPAGAAADATAALARNPLHPWAGLTRAAARARQGDTAGGRRAAEQALDLFPREETRRLAWDWYLRASAR